MSVAAPLLELEAQQRTAPPLPKRGRRDFESTRSLLGLLDLAVLGKTPAGTDDPSHGAIRRPILKNLLTALHYRDLETVRHSRRVSILAAGLARHLGWDGKTLKMLEVAALLHDIGKLGVPDNILFKPARLSPEEQELMLLHYHVSLDVLQACQVAPEVLQIIGQSQHAYISDADGRIAQPQELHLGARILSVADAYESLNSDQPYRPARSHAQIMTYLQQHAGKRFDGSIVESLINWLKLDGAPLEEVGYNAEESVSQAAQLSPEQILEANSLCRIFSYLHVLEGLYDGFTLFDANLNVVVWNRGVERLLHRPAATVLGQRWSASLMGYCDDDGHELGETESLAYRVLETGAPATQMVNVRRQNGSYFTAEVQCLPVFDATGKLRGITEILRDVQRGGGQHPLELRDLKLAATRDALTSVANRGELETRLVELIAAYSRDESQVFSIISIDPDRFRAINETWGHAVGDEVLVELARLLQKESYSGETIGRYGGQEFILLCPGATLEQAAERAERLRGVIQQSTFANNERIELTVSLGVAQAEAGDSFDSLFRRVTQALQNAKAEGRDQTIALRVSDTAPAAAKDTESEQSEDFLYVGRFIAVISFDMIVYKLRGFIDEHDAQLKHVTSESVRLRVGRGTFFGGWGRSLDRQPVELDLHLEGEVHDRGVGTSSRTSIAYKVRPRGRVRDQELFQQRARLLIRDLKHFFVTD